MKSKILSFYRKYRYKAKESIKWRKDYFFLKHSMNYHRIMRTLFSTSKFIILIVSLLYILVSSKMVLITDNHVPYLNINFCTEYIAKNGVLSTQITLTLICVSLIALISNIVSSLNDLKPESLICVSIFITPPVTIIIA